MAKNQTVTITGFDEFNEATEKFLKETEKSVVELLELSSTLLLRWLIIFTPEDTGRAAIGWIPAIGTPPSNWKPPKGLTSYTPSFYIPVSKIRPYTTIHLSNNVEYIKYLENGHSTQARNGMISDSIRITTTALNRRAQKLKRENYGIK